CQQYNTDPYIF
nr:immunoglobulin light chain junction region [Macaca mulatta]